MSTVNTLNPLCLCMHSKVHPAISTDKIFSSKILPYFIVTWAVASEREVESHILRNTKSGGGLGKQCLLSYCGWCLCLSCIIR